MKTEDPKLTRERLRNWIDSQSARERMCAALLPLLGQYSDVRPRRPLGGPDHARDIQALFNGTIEVWGAVGFKVGASGSNAHRTWAKKKFVSDLNSALDEKRELSGFVFFTNVDLTDSMKDALRTEAIGRGLQHVEIFDFERLALQLDSVEGLLTRVQYLDIPMSKDQQLLLINRFGSDLQQMMKNRFDDLQSMVKRLDFRAACALPLNRGSLRILLNKPTTADELVDASCMIVFLNVPQTDVLFLQCSAQPHDPNAAVGGSIVSRLWMGTKPHSPVHAGTNIGRGQKQFDASWKLSIHHVGHPLTLGDLSGCVMQIVFTKSLAERIARVRFSMNGFVVQDFAPWATNDYRYFSRREWAERLPEDVQRVLWTNLERLDPVLDFTSTFLSLDDSR